MIVISDLNIWIEYLKSEDRSLHTIEAYTRDVIEFFHYICKEPEDLTKDDTLIFKEYLKEKGISISSANRKYMAINNFLSFLQKELERNILIRIKPEKIQKQDFLEEMLTKKDFELLVETAKINEDYRAVAIFNTLFYTGMRVSESLLLKVSDIDSQTVTIKGKGSKHRDIFISKKLREILKTYLMYRLPTDSDSLFTGTKGPINRKTVDAIIKKYAKLSGVSITKAHAHNFRHLYCMSLMDNGLSIDTVADLAGHSNINTTRIYTRRTKSELLDTINNL